MTQWNTQRYLKEGRAANVSAAILRNAVKTAAITHAANPRTPPVLSLAHLAALTDVPYEFLRSVVSRGGDEEATFYQVFSLKKRDVGHQRNRTRTICAPHPLLLRAQRWIHENILKLGRFHESSCAYRPGSKIIEAAQLHCDARWMVKLDITSFFESITEPKIYKVFRMFGYQPLIAFELARICTRTRRRSPRRKKPPKSFKIEAYDDKRLGHLPQGAPTSPLLANLVVFGLDVALSKLAEENGMIYTRYADDITLSTSTIAWSRTKAVELLCEGHDVLRAHGFYPNQAKANIVPPGGRKVMLGLAVNDAVPRLTRGFKNKLRAHIFYLRRFLNSGVSPHEKLGFDSILGLQRHVFGLAYFAKGIEREWGTERLDELNALSWPTDHGISFD